MHRHLRLPAYESVLLLCLVVVAMGCTPVRAQQAATTASPAATQPHSPAAPVETAPVDRRLTKPIPPTSAELLERNKAYLRPGYFTCMQQAGNDLSVQVRCLDDEYAYQNAENNRVYQKVLSGLSPADRKAMRISQRRWLKQINDDPRCTMPSQPTVEEHISARQCLTAAAISSIVFLTNPQDLANALKNIRNPPRPPPPMPPSESGDGQPDAHGNLTITLTKATFQAQLDSCEDDHATSTTCRVLNGVTVYQAGLTQLLPVTQLLLYSPTHYIYGGTVTMTDLNGDGHDDLMLWTGRFGNYGSPSYNFYLFDSRIGKYVENHELERMTEGNDFELTGKNQFKMWWKSGACLRGERILEMRGMRPVIVFEKDNRAACPDR